MEILAPKPRRSGPTLADSVVIVAIVIVLICLLLPGGNVIHGPRRRSPCFNNLKQISLALQRYDARYGSLPPAYIADQNGKPMHSWRILILPFLEQEPLYKEYDFSEPWDGPHNSRLMQRCPKQFRCHEATNQNPSATSYVAVVGNTTMWPGNRGSRLEDIKDGTSNTIMLVEVADSDINWMEPRDLSFEQATKGVNVDKQHGISSNHAGIVCVAYADGHGTYLVDDVSSEALKALFTIAGGETVDEDQAGNLVVHPPTNR
jgi:hypothetical protein